MAKKPKAKTSKSSKARKVAKKAKKSPGKSGKPGKKPKTSELFLKPVPRNVIHLTEDGQVVVATSEGAIEVVKDKKLANILKNALLKRQKGGLAVTKLLQEAGFHVTSTSTTGMDNP